VTGRSLRDVVDSHTLHVRRGSPRDCRVNGTRVESVDRHGRAYVQVRVVHGVLGHHRREHEKLARAGNCQNPIPKRTVGQSVGANPRKKEQTWVEPEEMPGE
jgi:hypothetical protein